MAASLPYPFQRVRVSTTMCLQCACVCLYVCVCLCVCLSSLCVCLSVRVLLCVCVSVCVRVYKEGERDGWRRVKLIRNEWGHIHSHTHTHMRCRAHQERVASRHPCRRGPGRGERRLCTSLRSQRATEVVIEVMKRVKEGRCAVVGKGGSGRGEGGEGRER